MITNMKELIGKWIDRERKLRAAGSLGMADTLCVARREAQESLGLVWVPCAHDDTTRNPCPWSPGEPPRGGELHVAMGRIVGSDEWGGHSTPFLSRVRWGGSGGWSGWVDEHGMAISSDADEIVHIDHWCSVPECAEGGE